MSKDMTSMGYFIPGLKVMIKSDIFKDKKNVVVEVEFDDRKKGDIIEIEIDPNEENLQRQIFKKLLKHYMKLMYYPKKGIDTSHSESFVHYAKLSKDLIGLTEEDFDKEFDFVQTGYINERTNFDKNLEKMVEEIKKKGFKVRLGSEENFIFTFDSRKGREYNVHVPNYGKHSGFPCLFDFTEMVEFYTAEDVLKKLGEQMNPERYRNRNVRNFREMENAYIEYLNLMQPVVTEVKKQL